MDAVNYGKPPSIWWGSLIVSGTIIGAGMFTLPVMLSGAWYFWSIILLIISWSGMLVSGLLFFEASLNYPVGSGYNTLTSDLLGGRWNLVNNLSILFVLVVLTYAYISASGPVLSASISNLGLSVPMAKITFTIVIASFVWLGTAVVGRVSLILLGSKLIAFFTLFGGLLTVVDHKGIRNLSMVNYSYLPYTLAALPFCIASFGFHGNISGLVEFYKKDKTRIVGSISIGTLVAVVVYIFWLTGMMANITRSGFSDIIRNGGDVETIISVLKPLINNTNFNFLLSLFSNFAVACSFLGVSLGLFDFLSDLFKSDNSPINRFKMVVLTFATPLSMSLLFPDGFLYAIGFAGLIATIWAIFTPSMLAFKARKRFDEAAWRVRGGNITISFVVLLGVANIVSWLLNQFGLLPIYKG